VKSDLTLMQAALMRALEDLHSRIAQAILALDAQALDWRPAPGVNSVHELVLQAAAEEQRWMAECVLANLVPGTATDATTAADCTREAGSAVPLSDHPLHHLGCAGQISQTILAALAPALWTEAHEVDGREVTVVGCVLRVLDKLALTLGQIEVVAQWWRAGTEEREA